MPTSVAGLSSLAVQEAAMYRRPLLIVVLGLILAGCYAGPGYYESDVYTQPVYGGAYYGSYDRSYRPSYYVAPPRYYGPRPAPYYAPRPDYGPRPMPYAGRGYYRGDQGGHEGRGGHYNPSWNEGRNDGDRGHGGGSRGHDNGSGGRGDHGNRGGDGRGGDGRGGNR